MCFSSQDRMISSFRRIHSSGIMRLRYKTGFVIKPPYWYRNPSVSLVMENTTIKPKESQRLSPICLMKKDELFLDRNRKSGIMIYEYDKGRHFRYGLDLEGRGV